MFQKDQISLHQGQNVLVCLGVSAGASVDGMCAFVYVCVCLGGWEVRAINKTNYWLPFEPNEWESLSEQEMCIFLN